MSHKGIDISHYQGNIDFEKVKASGIEFVFIKATDSTNYIDPMFETNYKNAMAAGLKVGAYHFGRFGTVDQAKAEAEHFLSVIKGKVLTYPAVLDLEIDKYNDDVESLTDAAIAFLETLEDAGYFAMIYSGKAFYEGQLDGERLKPYATWIARYASKLGRDAGIWQYSNSGHVDGISGNVDMDIAYYDYSFTSPKVSRVNSVSVAKSAARVPKPTHKPDTKVITVTVKHKVVKGDTLSELAVHYGTTVSRIKKINGLHSDTIYIGQTLKIETKKTIKVSPPKSNKIPVKGKIRIVNVSHSAYIVAAPNKHSKNLAVIPKGKTINIAGSVPGWWEVIYNGKRAYVNEKFGELV